MPYSNNFLKNACVTTLLALSLHAHAQAPATPITPAATPAAPAAIPALATTNAAYLASSCANCHGSQGNAKDSMASLAGLKAEYIVEQMKAFKEGKRPASIMHQLAKGYTDAQIAAIAGYFAAQTAAK